ncbi:serine hydrolase domain-containing protein [Bosea rubneri]|uniref:Serine hydrolase domain-containing protein n=1 Tax=Bosea rubneri TaxID=3075434 RepID=A0ABU3SC52_9HYPH|nr:serine hydrolase domain-containing protein [Bosea sp. ZW T0_25]MDU0342355.1 serine hydrolase domain-containing protein [Bosea sp. ZW T0_25]
MKIAIKHRSNLVAALVTLASVLPSKAEITGEKLQALLPGLEQQVTAGMKEFSVPGVAIGIVFDDKLVYSKGFGVRTIDKADRVTPDTIFQVGSTTKAFLATALAQAVDAGRLKWTDPVVDYMPAFQLADPWVTRDFRILDLAAQRAGLTPYVHDDLTFLGFDKPTLIRSMRVAPQTGIFRSQFGYLNIPHMVGGEVLAKVDRSASWYDSVKKTLLDPLGMSSTTATLEAITQSADHATGHRFGERPVAIPFHAAMPYTHGPAGAFNSNVKDMAQWLRLQLGRGHFGGKVLVSEENLDVTWTPRVAMSERVSYAVGWVVNATPNGRVIWHNGGTAGFGAHAGFLPDGRTGIVILTNVGNAAMADALAQWFYDRALGNPEVDNIALAAAAVRANRELQRKQAAAFIAGPLSASASALAGSYLSPVLGTATVAIVEGKLRMTLEQTDAVAVLEPNRDDPNLFSARLIATAGYEPLVAMAGDVPFSQIRFERDSLGDITQLRWLAPELPHAFTRQPAH